MIKQVLQTALLQGKYKDICFHIWSWIYSQTDENNVYYGTMKEILENCQTEYSKINRALELQSQWNTEEFERTVVLRKDESDFLPCGNFHDTQKYFTDFKITVSKIRSLYKPLIIIFNDKTYAQLAEINKNKATGQEQVEEVHLNGSANHKAEKTEKKEKAGKPSKDVSKELINACLDVYFDFYQKVTGVKPKLSGKDAGIQIEALKRMIKYFRQNNTKDPSDSGVILSFDLIFQNWNKFNKFYQDQYKLTQIESNLVNLLAIIRTPGQALDKSRSAKAREFSEKFTKAIESGLLDERLKNLGKSSFTQQS